MSCEACGWMAAVGSCIAFGTFGVPIKSKRAKSVDIDPLVFQSYKTIMVFLTSWLVLLGGIEFSFTPWGIVSGMFWVPGGVGTVYAIKNAGLAIGIGTGSCFIVLVSFIWGVFIFKEHVHSHFGAVLAVGCLMAGVFGMGYYSSPESDTAAVESEDDINYTQVQAQDDEDDSDDVANFSISDEDNADDEDSTGISLNHRHSKNSGDGTGNDATTTPDSSTQQPPPDDDTAEQGIPRTEDSEEPRDYERIFGRKMKKRHLGILAAALFTGVWGGSILAPMKFCKDERTEGVGFLISFAIGASLVTLFLWFLRWMAQSIRLGSMSKGYESLPSFHIRVMWLPGGIGGILWAIGNFFSLISVYYLGEGVGYPLVQTSILVSGLWGIFYFKEIKGTRRISMWLASACLSICGILLLSYEHHAQ